MTNRDEYKVLISCCTDVLSLVVSLSGLAPFSSRGDDPNHLTAIIKNGRFSFPNPQWSKVSEKAKDLVRCLLTVDPSKRMTIEQAESHSWMSMGSKSKRKDLPNGLEQSGSADKRRSLGANRATPPTFDGTNGK